MVSIRPSRSQEIRSRLGHPIIDSDGHTLEVMPLVVEFVGEVGGAKMKKRYEEGLAQAVGVHWHEMSQAAARLRVRYGARVVVRIAQDAGQGNGDDSEAAALQDGRDRDRLRCAVPDPRALLRSDTGPRGPAGRLSGAQCLPGRDLPPLCRQDDTGGGHPDADTRRWR